MCDEDDDGEHAMERKPKQVPIVDIVLASQLIALIDNDERIEKTICTKLGISSIANIPQDRYAGILNWVKEQKK